MSTYLLTSETDSDRSKVMNKTSHSPSSLFKENRKYRR